MTISFRLALSAALNLLLVAMLIGFAYWASVRTDAASSERRDARTINIQVNQILTDLLNAETGQRGFILTGSESYLEPFRDGTEMLDLHLSELKSMVAPKAELSDRVDALRDLAAQRVADLRAGIEARRQQGLDAALQVIGSNRGEDLMDSTRAVIGEIDAVQMSVVLQKDEDLRQTHASLLLGLMVGGCVAAMTIVLSKFLLYRSFKSPVGEISRGMLRVASGDLEREIDLRGKDELSNLGRSFNAMVRELRDEKASRQHAEEELETSNQALLARSGELETRTRTIDLLGRMANRLPGCTDEAEFVEVIERFGPQILPGAPGIIYSLTNSQNLLRRIGSWNNPKSSHAEFAPMECWGLRRGQPHEIEDVHADIICGHIDPDTVLGYRCLPLVAQGETVGLLYLEEAADYKIDDQDLAVFTETTAFALANLRLRERLRNQSVRDVLTGLFNRRYLEETLELEFARARREQRPASIIMLDIDHFKRFNDLHGHDAGDLVLKAVGQVIKGTIRTSDIACRYGGEEFMLVLPGNTVEEAAALAERVRTATEEIEISHNNATLGKVTMSLGVAAYPRNGDLPADVVAAADRALYAAKGAGRNTFAIAPLPVVAEPASAS